MSRRNRVTPLGELIAVPERGTVYGNRGYLHDAEGTIRRHHATRRWITCRLEFNGWHRSPLMQPGRFTELFFLDEATAFAAGHRPCALCRRADYDRFLAITGEPGADALDTRLHAERLGPRPKVDTDGLPEGAFVLHADTPHVILDGQVRRWTPAGYGEATAPPARAGLVTPPTTVEVLRAGWDAAAVPLILTGSRAP